MQFDPARRRLLGRALAFGAWGAMKTRLVPPRSMAQKAA
jgi:hypothetical protein